MTYVPKASQFIPGRRGLIAVRAESAAPSLADIAKMIASVQTAQAAFKAEVDGQLKAKADVVAEEKIARISSDVVNIQTAIDEANRMIAALSAGEGSGSADPRATPERRAYDAASLRYVRAGENSGVTPSSLRDLAVKAGLTTQSDPDGGFVVTNEMERAVDRVLTRLSVIRSLAQVRAISAATFSKAITTQGAVATWAGEEETRPETQNMRISMQTYTPGELYANIYATQIMLEDAFVNVEEWVGDEAGLIFAEAEGLAFTTGTGPKRPRGLLTYPIFQHTATPETDTVPWGNIATVNTGAAADFAASNPMDAIYRLKYALRVPYHNNASWLMNRRTAFQVRTFKDTQGRYLWEPSNQVGQPALLDGHPAVIDDNMPSVAANAVVMAFGDFQRAYLIVDRVGLSTLRDPYTQTPNVRFYIRRRTGAGIQNFEAIKFLQCRT